MRRKQCNAFTYKWLNIQVRMRVGVDVRSQHEGACAITVDSPIVQNHAVPETQMSWVVAEHTAASAGELSVSKGQQVELVEPWAARAEWWVVRVPGTGEAAQGAVPVHVLKPQPQPHTQPPPAPHTHRKTSPSPSPSRRPLAQPDEPLVPVASAQGRENYNYRVTTSPRNSPPSPLEIASTSPILFTLCELSSPIASSRLVSLNFHIHLCRTDCWPLPADDPIRLL
ncbi:hypothetical protein RR46_04411 [Papilio xuthus]|uniref:SH3 domain-containing protein n=1 Tax=Papilio xuthus TaxID=66420 RepID=A0A194PMX2_PAPXU|nr:hypothetical protein RR46_04411 [Papilio xuthus]